MHPIDFSCGGSNSSIFRFSRGSSHYFLFLRFSTNWVTPKKHDIGRCGSAIIRVSHLISICKGIESEWRVLSKKQAKMNSAFKIPKNPLNCRPMSNGQAVHELRELVHCKRYIKSSEGKVLYRSNDLTVFSGISWKGPIMQLKGHVGGNRGGNCISTKHIVFRQQVTNVFVLRTNVLITCMKNNIMSNMNRKFTMLALGELLSNKSQ